MLEEHFLLDCFAHKVVYGKTIANVHTLAFDEFISYHNITEATTEDGEKVIELGPRTYVVEDITYDRYLRALPYTERFLNQYTDAVLNGYEHSDFEYDYYSRLNFYYGHNQIQEMLNKLIAHPNTRRAVAITWMPEIDNTKKDVPCLQYIQCFIRNDALYMNVMFRSNDMLMAFGCNAYALTTLQKNICDYVSRSINKRLDYGYYMHTSICPHIYYERDAEEYRLLLER